MATLSTAAAAAAVLAARNAGANAAVALANNGRLRIYAGTVPADANAALSSNPLLAELTFGATAFGAASVGVATANAITADSAADATGTPTFFRVFQNDGTTVVWQGTAGATGQELNLSGLTGGQIVAGASVAVSSLTYTQNATLA